MLVRDYMAKDLVVIAPQQSVADALELLRQKNIRRLPVVDKGRLVGIVTESDLREVSPSSATSLNIWEIPYLIAKITIKEVIKKQKLITVGADAYLVEAAIMRQNKIGFLPVVEGGKLVGIITESNIFDAFMKLVA